MNWQNLTVGELILLCFYTVVFCYGAKIIYGQITEPFKKLVEPPITEGCEGCGNRFNHKLHDHFGYRSCSVACDDFLDEVFEETKY